MSDRPQLDPQALGQHIEPMSRRARILCRSSEEAEDLVQETFVRILQKQRILTADGDLGYLLRALRSTFVSTRRTASRRPQADSFANSLDLVDDPSAIRPESGLEVAELLATIAALPDDLRNALVAIDVVGLSYREAAGSLQVCEATLATRLHRARSRVIARIRP